MSTAGIVLAAVFGVVGLIALAFWLGVYFSGRSTRKADAETSKRVRAEVDADAAKIRTEEEARSDDDVFAELQRNTRRAR